MLFLVCSREHRLHVEHMLVLSKVLPRVRNDCLVCCVTSANKVLTSNLINKNKHPHHSQRVAVILRRVTRMEHQRITRTKSCRWNRRVRNDCLVCCVTSANQVLTSNLINKNKHPHTSQRVAVILRRVTRMDHQRITRTKSCRWNRRRAMSKACFAPACKPLGL